MYILKNALRCISRAKGRNVLIGIIVLVIAVSACIGLSIRQAAESAKEDALSNLSITGTISFDRQSMMSEMGRHDGDPSEGGERGEFDRSKFKEMMGNSSSLTLEEYQTYAQAESVKDFYYSLTASVNGSDEFEPVSSETEDETEEATENTSEDTSDMSQMGGMGFPGGMGGQQGGMMGGKMGLQSDFKLVGYSSEEAMTEFKNGTSTITDGSIFEEGTDSLDCIISDELATYNELAVGDTIIITNPDNEDEEYKLKVVGTYTNSSSNESSFTIPGMTSNDPANSIYLSYTALNSIIVDSEKANEVTDDESEEEATSSISSNLEATYVFADVAAYESFEAEVRELGLDDSYTIASQDITSYENSLAPLNTLSTMAGWFLLVILIIGAIILIVLNIFNVRERKYEIGVLTAMGMKKGKVAMQFMTEIFAVTLTSVLIGVIIGALSAVPVTNALLENQVSSQQTQLQQVEENFGRPGNMPQGDMGSGMPGNMGQAGGMDFSKGFGAIFGEETQEYITEINSAMNFTVVLQMLGIAVLLTLVSGTVSMLFVMRYEPLKILANRD